MPADQAVVFEDPWFWLRDDTRTDPEVLAHLREENAYTAQETAHLQSFKDSESRAAGTTNSNCHSAD